MKKRLTKDRLIELDTELYNSVLASEKMVTDNSIQKIRWFIDTKEFSQSEDLLEIVQPLLSDTNYFTKWWIDRIENENVGYTIVISTPQFQFNLQNILDFSYALFKISQQGKVEYRSWKIGIVKKDRKKDPDDIIKLTWKKIETVGDLKKYLRKLNDDEPIMMSIDADGDEYHRILCLDLHIEGLTFYPWEGSELAIEYNY